MLTKKYPSTTRIVGIVLRSYIPNSGGEYLYCAFCAPLCLRRGAADPLPDDYSRDRRSGFLRNPGKLPDLCSGQIQKQNL